MTVFQDNIRVSSDIFTYLQNDFSGDVLLNTSKGIYLQFPSKILLLADKSYGVTPIGLGLTRFVDFLTDIKPLSGQVVRYYDGLFYFQNGILEPNWDVVEPRWDLYKPQKEQLYFCAEQLEVQSNNSRGVASLVTPLLLHKPLPNGAQENSYCRLSLPILQELTESESCDIEDAVHRLIGLGLGLTPSLDDVMLGLVYGLQRFAPGAAKTIALQNAILNHAPYNTNTISAAYLDAVAKGGMFEILDNLICCLSGKAPLNISPILQIGSSSGSEMLLGLLLAAKMTMKG